MNANDLRTFRLSESIAAEYHMHITTRGDKFALLRNNGIIEGLFDTAWVMYNYLLGYRHGVGVGLIAQKKEDEQE